MKILYKSLIPVLLILSSCGTVKDTDRFTKNGLMGNIDSVVVLKYKEWDNKNRTGVDVIGKQIIHYDLHGNVLQEKSYKNNKGELTLRSKDEYVYSKDEKIEYTKTSYTREEELKGVVSQKIKERTPEKVVWATLYDIEGEEERLEIIEELDGLKIKTFYKDLESGKSDLQVITDSYASGQLKRKTHRSKAVSSIVDYTYYPQSAYMRTKRMEASFFFSEMLSEEGTEYVYFDSDERGNWKHRVLILSRQGVHRGMQYETQQVFYRD